MYHFGSRDLFCSCSACTVICISVTEAGQEQEQGRRCTLQWLIVLTLLSSGNHSEEAAGQDSAWVSDVLYQNNSNYMIIESWPVLSSYLWYLPAVQHQKPVCLWMSGMWTDSTGTTQRNTM